MFQSADLITILPEIFMLVMTCVILLVDIHLRDERRTVTYLLSLFTLVFAVILTLGPHGSPAQGESIYAFNDTFVRDGMADLLKVFIFIITGAVFLYSRQYLQERDLFKGEFYVLGLFGVLGMMVLVSASNMLTVYLGLELFSLSTYALVALHRDSPRAAEAAMKYFILGALASGMLLYGISMVYGSVGSLALADVRAALTGGGGDDPVLAFGLAFVVVGVAFKFGAVPFHMWIPDVYEGAPTIVTSYIGSAPKLAAFALAFRLLEDGLGGLHGYWQDMLVFLAILSMALGNVLAIAQTNLKRMLAYSTIAHVGFLLLGFLAGTPEGYAAAMFYAIAYGTMSAGAFGMIIYLSRAGFEAEELADFKGLNQRSPWFAGIMLMLMASLAGFPPFFGFFAKLLVFKAVIDAGLIWVAVLGVFLAVIGAYYYLRIIKLMYFDEPATDAPIKAGADLRATLTVNGLAQIFLGFFSGGLAAACLRAFA
jgi:NADH-quinone oxidoreductase subunit N